MSWRADPLGPWLDEADADRERNPYEPDPEPWRPTHRETMPLDEHRARWIAQNCCPRVACHETLDDGACPRCGWTLADERRPVEVVPDAAAQLFPPEILQFEEEFAEAQLDVGDAA